MNQALDANNYQGQSNLKVFVSITITFSIIKEAIIQLLESFPSFDGFNYLWFHSKTIILQSFRRHSVTLTMPPLILFRAIQLVSEVWLFGLSLKLLWMLVLLTIFVILLPEVWFSNPQLKEEHNPKKVIS